MKRQMLKYAGLMLAAAMTLAAVDSASASSKKSSKNNRYDSRDRDCDRDRYDRDCDRRDRDRDCDDDDSGSPGTVAPAIDISPVGSVVTTSPTITITAPFTAPANSGAVVTLLKDGVPVGTFVVPTDATTGSAVFTGTLVNPTTVFQAQLTFTTTSGGDDDDDDCDRSGGKYQKKKKGKGSKDCHDDDDEDGGTTVTTTLLSGTLTVIRQGGTDE